MIVFPPQSGIIAAAAVVVIDLIHETGTMTEETGIGVGVDVSTDPGLGLVLILLVVDDPRVVLLVETMVKVLEKEMEEEISWVHSLCLLLKSLHSSQIVILYLPRLPLRLEMW